MANPVLKVNLSIYKNSAYTHLFRITDSAGSPADLTGYSALLDMRASGYADEALYQATDADDLYIDEANGYVYLAIPATTIEAWTFDSAVYDLVLQAGGVAAASIAVARGSVTVYDHVTDI